MVRVRPRVVAQDNVSKSSLKSSLPLGSQSLELTSLHRDSLSSVQTEMFEVVFRSGVAMIDLGKA